MENRSLQRKLAAILIADAVGFSRRMGENEEGALRALNARRELIVHAVGEYRGRVFGGAGDSVIAEFSSAVDALRMAIEVQKAISALNEAVPGADQMLFRFGINIGDVIVEEGNLFGDGVNVAERLQALAEPGQICISSSVHEQVRDKLRLAYHDLGNQTLKNIIHPVRAFLVGGSPFGLKPAQPMTSRRRIWLLAAILGVVLPLAAAAFYLRPWQNMSTLDKSGPPTIAVLPFANQSGDVSQNYFSDGITQDIIAALGRFSNLSVLASSATSKFKGSNADSAELWKKLGARYLVIGSVRRSGNRVRVTADLTDTARNLHLWSRQFEGDLTEIFSVQDEITRDIVGALAIKLSRIEQDRAYAKQTERLDAYDYFLRGRALMAIGERAQNRDARVLFEKAIAIDPRYTAAIVWLGFTYQYEATSGWTEFAAEALDRAEKLGRQALKLSPELAESYQLLAVTYLARGDYDRAIIEAKQAVEINPSDAYSHATLGYALMWTGDAEGAIAAVERAKIFDPSLQWDSLMPLGFAYYLAGRYEDAIATLEPIAGSGSDFGLYAFLAAAYAQLGRTDEAQKAATEVKRLWPFFRISRFTEQWRDERTRKLIATGLAKAGLE
jgi:TolB-like protein/class 3 adenylate cyclase/Flp pilus assembly protein TadD